MAKKPSNKKKKNSIDASLEIGGNVDRSNIVIGDSNVINITPEQISLRALHQLPPPPGDFTGREALIEELLEDFESRKGATISGLTGMGGVGKTALGLVVANQIQDQYPEAQIFLDLKGTTEPLSALDIARHIITAFEPTSDLHALNEANMQAAYQSVLHKRKVLLFFDNVRSAEQIAPLMPPETCAMVVTSRWSFSMPGLTARRLAVMSGADANNFLIELCPRISDKANDLAKACGYLPLALRIAGSFLSERIDWTPEEYLGRLRETRSKFLKVEDDTTLDLEATIELSYESLTKLEQDYWCMLGVFPGSFRREAAAFVWNLEMNLAHDYLSKFYKKSLLDYDTKNGLYRLHDLLYDFAGQRISTDLSLEASNRYMDFISSSFQDFLITGDFHEIPFSPDNILAWGLNLVNQNPDQAIGYFHRLVKTLYAMPWALHDIRVILTIEIALTVLIIAYNTKGETEMSNYYVKFAERIEDLKNAVLRYSSASKSSKE